MRAAPREGVVDRFYTDMLLNIDADIGISKVQSLTLKYNWVKAQAPGMGVGVFAINYPLGGDKMWQALQTFSSSERKTTSPPSPAN